MSSWNYPTSQDYRISDHIVESLHIFFGAEEINTKKQIGPVTPFVCSLSCYVAVANFGFSNVLWYIFSQRTGAFFFGTWWRKEKLRSFFGDSPF